MRREALLALLLAGAIALLPVVVRAGYYRDLVVVALVWVAIAQAWNLLGGYAGQVSFGHAAFFGASAYVTAWLAAISPAAAWAGIVAGGLAAGCLSVPIGLLCFRLRGPYFALATLAVAEVLRYAAKNQPLSEWTRGDQGLLLAGLGEVPALLPYYAALLLAAMASVAVELLVRSRLGYYALAIREDQDAAEAIGIPTARVKGTVLFLSAAITGAAGGLQALRLGQVYPETFFSLPHVSVAAILIVMLGGVAHRWGPVLGAFLYVALEEIFRTWIGEGHLLVFGGLLVLVIVFLPRGAVDLPARLLARRPVEEEAP